MLKDKLWGFYQTDILLLMIFWITTDEIYLIHAFSTTMSILTWSELIYQVQPPVLSENFLLETIIMRFSV